jgi:hypothetical protein
LNALAGLVQRLSPKRINQVYTDLEARTASHTVDETAAPFMSARMEMSVEQLLNSNRINAADIIGNVHITRVAGNTEIEDIAAYLMRFDFPSNGFEPIINEMRTSGTPISAVEIANRLRKPLIRSLLGKQGAWALPGLGAHLRTTDPGDIATIISSKLTGGGTPISPDDVLNALGGAGGKVNNVITALGL